MILLACAWALVAQTEPAAAAVDASDVVVDPVEAVPSEHEANPLPIGDVEVEVEAVVVAPPLRSPLSQWVRTCLAQAPQNIEAARLCLRTIVDDEDSSAVERADAVEAERVLARLQRHQPAPPPAPVAAPRVESVDARAFVVGGQLEAGVNGALFGGVVGFTGAAGVLSGLRSSEKDAVPWLLSAPALGAILGASAGVAAVEWLDADADDVAFVASSTWAGTALGLTLQLAIFSESSDVQAAPLRFFTTLGGGVLGLGLGAGLAPFLDVKSGDAALANDGLLWGSVLTALVLGSVQPQGIDFGVVVVTVGAGGLLSWGTLLAVHPLLGLHRASTWLIDVGGVLGLMGGAVLGGFAATAMQDGRAFLPGVTVGTLLGLGVGVVSAVVVDQSTHKAFAPPAPLTLAPTVLPTSTGFAPGVTLQVALW